MIEDYRAGASIDLEHADAASTAAGSGSPHRARCCGGSAGWSDATGTGPLRLATVATTPELVTGSVITGAGHFLAEENDADTLAAVQAFLRP